MAKKETKQPVHLQNALVLHKYILSLFGCKDFETLSSELKDPALEGVDDEGVSNIHYALKQHLYNSRIPKEKLLEYDQNIVHHTREINGKRKEQIKWKYFQYLALLFTEIYLDSYFTDKQALLDGINDFLHNEFNARSDTWHEMPDFTADDLNKLAFWCATGSGKTLLMHINIKQYLHYAEKHNAKKLNRIIILTPNEGLSVQHLREMQQSGIQAKIFSKSGGAMFRGRDIEIVDINKLADADGDKTVAVESFEGNNLVLVDEGHKGSGGDVWKGYRDTLTQEGFSFEYSATFGQAIAAQTGSNRKELLQEYGKATLFDYSYRYFYNDGYGKDYRIMNISLDDEELLNMYLTAYLLCLYEQSLVFESTPSVRNQFLIARPLGVFVGCSVNAVREENKKKVSDVVQILLFLQDFIEKRDTYSIYIKRLLDPEDGIKNARGFSIFANSFNVIKKDLQSGDEANFAKSIYDKVLKTIFHCSSYGAKLHIIRQKGGDGEIALCVGSNENFGVINVGDSDKLINLCSENGLHTDSMEFGETSLFNHINDDDSKINILIGSKKFSEGWSSWRVSALGLMNVGRKEGSEIIQLFGRGVRLKGFSYSLKRSSALDTNYYSCSKPKWLNEIETLNIFGVRADYMKTFREYLEKEGLPHNEENYEAITVPTIKLLDKKKLKIVRLKKGVDFRKSVTVHPLDLIDKVLVKLDWTPKVEALWSKGTQVIEGNATGTEKLKEQLAFINWNKIFFAIEHMKNERGWYNMEISQKLLIDLMDKPDWYELTIPKEILNFHDFGKDVARWEEITIALLRAYIDKAYKLCRGQWESQYMETVYIDKNDPNFFNEYTVEVRKDKEEWIEKLKELNKKIKAGNLVNDFAIEASWIQALRFDQHLYYPLLCLTEKDKNGNSVLIDKNTNEPLIKISPVALNAGEKTFVKDLYKFYEDNKSDVFKGKEVYLLRNESRKGIGFFESCNFYPDFILWVNEGEKQHVTVIDPKGIRNLRGLEDPKIQLFNLLKTAVQPSLNDPDIILDSFIISNTNYSQVKFWGSKDDFKNAHVLFQEGNYIEALFKIIM